MPSASAKIQPPGKMIRHLLSYLQQVDILKVPDKVVSTALMAAAVAVRSAGLIFIVGDKTQVSLTAQTSRGHVWDAGDSAPLQPSQGQTTEHGHKTRHKWPSTDASQDLTFRERRKGHMAHLMDIPDP